MVAQAWYHLGSTSVLKMKTYKGLSFIENSCKFLGVSPCFASFFCKGCLLTEVFVRKACLMTRISAFLMRKCCLSTKISLIKLQYLIKVSMFP